MSINDFSNKIKSKLGLDNMTLMYLLIIIGVSLCSFGLGYLSATSSPNRTEEIFKINDSTNLLNASAGEIKILDINKNISTDKTGEKVYVASKNGKLYYGVGCSGAKRIKEENKVWFATTIDAEKSGYAPSSSCK